jgi:tRNA (adenine57-N1/adenine58-N1)-methyltransferase
MGYIHVLKPNPYLITETVAHKTQILFQMDISMILLMLDIRPGRSVVESGTGSGSLTSSIA